MTMPNTGSSAAPGEPKPTPQGGTGETPPVKDTAPPTPPPAGGDDDELDLASLPPKAQTLITKLRKENADRRTKTNNLQTQLDAIQSKVKALATGQDESEPPETTIEKLGATNHALQMRGAVLELAIENGIGKDGLDYFNFLLNQKAAELKEGEELDAEVVKSVVAEVRAKSRSTSAQPPITSVTTPGTPPPPGSPADLTVEQFAKMGMVAKGDLYSKQPKLYESLFATAKEKGLI